MSEDRKTPLLTKINLLDEINELTIANTDLTDANKALTLYNEALISANKSMVLSVVNNKRLESVCTRLMDKCVKLSDERQYLALHWLMDNEVKVEATPMMVEVNLKKIPLEVAMKFERYVTLLDNTCDDCI